MKIVVFGMVVLGFVFVAIALPGVLLREMGKAWSHVFGGIAQAFVESAEELDYRR
jgi:hypothetical protein